MPRQSKVFSFLKSDNGALDISMYGVLYGDWFKGSEEADLVAAIKSCAPTDAITLHINSEGGDMFAGIAIRNILEAHPGEVTCVVEGLAASAASIAAMAGRTVMRSGAMMMIHNPWTVVAGDADDMRAAAEMLDKSRDALVAIYQEKTGKSVAELKALLSAETWMTAAEAVKAGFADDEDDDEDDDDTMDVVALSKRRVSINNVAFPTNRVPPQILAMARPVNHPTEEYAMKSVLAALSLKDNANEGEALIALNKISEERKQLLSLTGKDSVAEAMGILAAWKSSAAEIVSIKAEMEKKAAEQDARDFDAEIAAGKAAHKLAPSDSHERNVFALSFKGKAGAIDTVSAYIKTLQPLVPAASTAAAPAEPPASAPVGVIALTDEEKRIAAKMGLSHDKVIKNKQRLLAKALEAPSKRASDEDDEEDAA